MARRPRPIGERFDEKVDRNGECWLWLRTIDGGGYGQFWIDNRTTGAHRFAWEREHGPIPPGMQIDHLCRNRACVRPAHLELVTARENTMRGIGASAFNAAKTHCIHAHPLSGGNLYVTPDGRRQCRTCNTRRQAEWLARERERA